MNSSVLTYNQKKIVVNKSGKIVTFCEIRYDDECRNGHNTFSITGQVYEKTRKRDLDKWDLRIIDGEYYEMVTCGCIHGTIARTFPQFKHLIKYHLCSSEGPLHYKANTKYWAKLGDLENARKSAIWETATLDQLLSDNSLDEHLITLKAEFKQAIEDIGFTW